jgi:ketopantoate reductase
MKIAVIGTGALGSLFAGYLSRSGEDVSAVDIKPEIISAIHKSGVKIKEAEGKEIAIPLRTTLRPEEIGKVDLVIFLTKSGQTKEAARSARCLFGDGTVGLTLQNGLGNPEAIETEFFFHAPGHLEPAADGGRFYQWGDHEGRGKDGNRDPAQPDAHSPGKNHRKNIRGEN